MAIDSRVGLWRNLLMFLETVRIAVYSMVGTVGLMNRLLKTAPSRLGGRSARYSHGQLPCG